MSQFTDFLGLRYPEEGIDFMRASLDIEAAYKLIDTFAEKVGNPIRGSMSKSVDGVNRVAGQFFTMDFDVADYNIGGIVNLSNNKFTIPTDDFYIALLQASWNNGSSPSASARQIFIQRNAVAVAGSYTVENPSNRGPVQQCMWMGQCNSGDSFDTLYRHDDTAAIGLDADQHGGTYFKIWRGSFVD